MAIACIACQRGRYSPRMKIYIMWIIYWVSAVAPFNACMQTAESINTAVQRSTGENVRKRKIGSNSLRRRCRFLCFSHVNGLVYRGGGSALTNIRFNFTCRYVVAEACEFWFMHFNIFRNIPFRARFLGRKIPTNDSYGRPFLAI